MEVKLYNGAVCRNALGMPETVYGLEAILQRAQNRLNIHRGQFRYDRTLGSRIGTDEVTAETALRFAQEALLPCPEITVIDAALRENAVTVLLSTPLGEGSVTVTRKEAEDDI